MNPHSSLVTPIRVVRASESLKPAVSRQRTVQGRETHGGVKRGSALGKYCQELGRPAGQHLRESDEVVVALKRVTIVERRASADEELSKKRNELVNGNIYDRECG